MTLDTVLAQLKRLTGDKLNQTPFAADGRQLTQASVLEITGQPAQLVFKADEVKFVASGRKDMDVRMLGNGRPFYLELLNPKQAAVTAEALDDLAKATNQVPQVQVRSLCLVAKADACLIKGGEESKAKTYSCLVWTEQVLTDAVLAKLAPLFKAFNIQQQTPLRVLHRRAQLRRPKHIHGMSITPLADHFVNVTLCTEAGTYIKEFIHGDCARSTPSFAQMISCRADLLALDVVTVDLQWPPTGFFPPPLVTEPCALHDVGFRHDSLYLAGQYNKCARDISQTPFAADGRQLAQTSVSEIIGQPAQLVFKADEVKLVASGREDIDVRMLGSDHPFYLKLLSPKQTVVAAKALDDLVKAINQTEQMAGCRADLLALDVVTVDLQWPPSA
ncbi:hypothetical protein H4R35_002410 [Dimargaris xerosporica]|nr:hypothetical protein H4R35_002410 [Dimargaris xerosporica]